MFCIFLRLRQSQDICRSLVRAPWREDLVPFCTPAGGSIFAADKITLVRSRQVLHLMGGTPRIHEALARQLDQL